MTPQDLRRQCRSQIDLVGQRAVVVLIQPGYANHATARLARGRGPSGRVCGPGPTEGTKIVMYDAATVLRWLDQHVLDEAPAAGQEERG